MDKLFSVWLILVLLVCMTVLTLSIDAMLHCQRCGWDGNDWLGLLDLRRACYRETTEGNVTIRETVPFLEATTIYCLEVK